MIKWWCVGGIWQITAGEKNQQLKEVDSLKRIHHVRRYPLRVIGSHVIGCFHLTPFGSATKREQRCIFSPIGFVLFTHFVLLHTGESCKVHFVYLNSVMTPKSGYLWEKHFCTVSVYSFPYSEDYSIQNRVRVTIYSN